MSARPSFSLSIGLHLVHAYLLEIVSILGTYLWLVNKRILSHHIFFIRIQNLEFIMLNAFISGIINNYFFQQILLPQQNIKGYVLEELRLIEYLSLGKMYTKYDILYVSLLLSLFFWSCSL